MLNEAKSSEPDKYQENKESLRKRFDFVCRNYLHQYYGGRLLLHERCQQASSWDEESRRQIMSLPGVEWVDMHECQLGQDNGRGDPVKTPARWLSNSKRILKMLDVRCPGKDG